MTTCLRTTRSRCPRRYSMGYGHALNCDMTSTARIARARAAITAGLTAELALNNSSRSSGVSYRPRSALICGKRGLPRKNTGRTIGRANLGNHVIGLVANEAHRMTPRRPAGASAASMMASGPENDSPSNTNEPEHGSSALLPGASPSASETIGWIPQHGRLHRVTEGAKQRREEFPCTVHSGHENQLHHSRMSPKRYSTIEVRQIVAQVSRRRIGPTIIDGSCWQLDAIRGRKS